MALESGSEKGQWVITTVEKGERRKIQNVFIPSKNYYTSRIKICLVMTLTLTDSIILIEETKTIKRAESKAKRG